MAHVRFTITADCEDNEASRVFSEISGEIFQYSIDDGEELILGNIEALLASQSRALNEAFVKYQTILASTRSRLTCATNLR